jgi:hypothetical protein
MPGADHTWTPADWQAERREQEAKQGVMENPDPEARRHTPLILDPDIAATGRTLEEAQEIAYAHTKALHKAREG